MSKRKVTAKKTKAKSAPARKAPPVVKRAKRKPTPAKAAAHGGVAVPSSSPAAPAVRGPSAALSRALAMASAEVGEVQVKSRSGPTQTLDDDEPVVVTKTDHAPKADHASPTPTPPAHAASPSPAPASGRGKTVVVDDEDAGDDGPVVVKGGAPKVQETLGDGIQVASKGPAKFSLDDLEALRKAIVIKGAGRIVAGINLDELKYDQEGLVAVVTQDHVTGAVLMQAWANKEALEKSLTTNEMTYFSRQRNKLWTKGEDSGNTQRLLGVRIDCDKDSVLAIVEQTGVACHRETGTCFSDGRDIPVAGFLGELDQLIAQRAKDRPEGSYTTTLLEDPSLAAGKVVEEAKEVALVLKGKPNKDTLQHEAADLLYHLLVACRGKGVGLRDILGELAARHKKDTKRT